MLGMYANEKSEESYHQENTGLQCSGCRNLTSRIVILENNTKQVMATLRQILDVQRNGTENNDVIKIQ